MLGMIAYEWFLGVALLGVFLIFIEGFSDALIPLIILIGPWLAL